MKKSGSKKFVIPAAACLAVILFLCYYFFFTAMTRGEGSRYVYIDEDDNIDSVYAQLDTMSRSHALAGFKTLTRGRGRLHRVQEAEERPAGLR